MKMNIKGTNVELTEDVRAYLDKRLTGLKKFLGEAGESGIAYVELGRTTQHHHTGNIFRAELTLESGGKSFRAVCEREDLRSAVDGMRDELFRELSSHKKKNISLLRRSGQRVKDFIRRFYR